MNISKINYNQSFEYLSSEKFTDICDISIYEENYLNVYSNIKRFCKYIIYANSKINDDMKYKISNSFTFFVKTILLDYFIKNILPIISNKFILITHASDLCSCNKDEILNNRYLIKWLGQNALINDKVEGIPIGLQNTSFEGWNYNICKYNKNNIKKYLLYINFSLKTNKKRKVIYNILYNNGFKMYDKLKWNKYIEILSQHKFCISPPGNGVDCHRIWESIYVGCIPIVEKNDILYNYFNTLPILWIKDYSIITTDYLNNEYNRIKNTNFNLEKSTLKYWIDKIEYYRTSF